jgi:hypothetical protein
MEETDWDTYTGDDEGDGFEDWATYFGEEDF